MATTTKKKVSGGGKLTRTQTVPIRLDPQLRYLAELAAKTQRRTVSSFIEWAIEESLKQITFEDYHGNSSTLADEAFQLWDVDEPDNFVKLAFEHPPLTVPPPPRPELSSTPAVSGLCLARTDTS